MCENTEIFYITLYFIRLTGKKYPVSCVVFFYRAATIVLRENNCHFLRVDKENFNRILRDVEANTVRLKEHGQDVLVLEKISPTHSAAYSHFKYVLPRSE
jgi:hypothetical protein